jgi:dUTP pyrophosphatase
MADKTVKINLIDGTLPKKGTENSAGYDICCLNDFTIKPGEQICLKTGIFMELPKGTYAELRTRSSMAKDQVRVEAGIIDSDYRGEILVLLYNYGTAVYKNTNKRIAQMIIHPFGEYTLVEDKLSKSDRKGGFGSTNF